MPSKEYLEMLKKMREIHIKKSADYSTNDNPMYNFEFTSELLKHFKNPEDQVFVALIGVKLARLAALLANLKTAQNESIEDTFIDLANYCLLWGASYKAVLEDE